MPPFKSAIRTIHFVSLGCAKNRVDTEVMAGIAVEQGLRIVANPLDAEIIVVNTCGFIRSAKEESIQTLLEMARYRTSGRLRLLVSAGCLSQRYGEELARNMPELSHVFGTSYPDWIARIVDRSAPRVQIGPAGHFLQDIKTPRFIQGKNPSAYLKIADGCSRRCAFCAIPLIRGKAKSRAVGEIRREVEKMAGHGIKEICLVAQDSSAYGRDLNRGIDLVRLLRVLNSTPGITWIRLLYLYPDRVIYRLLEALPDLPKVVPYLDIPIQHASDRMLKEMRRGHHASSLRRLMERIRKQSPQIFLRTTVLVGYPTESESDFKALLDFLAEIEFDHIGAFRYSREEGTRSYAREPRVPPAVSYSRLRKIMALGRRISKRRNKMLNGKTVDVLVEGAADDDGFVLFGRHQGQAPEVDGVTYIVSSSAQFGDTIRARVIKSDAFDLVVEPI
ncbi:MAG: 30S ribosomal protein S12 methylthiotransferase RimO [Deltaproteobacteria bacterium]|nr:30S ribosomal protein S12 methylthiotransferase RimO [Deltaproteobacteria bacterium]